MKALRGYERFPLVAAPNDQNDIDFGNLFIFEFRGEMPYAVVLFPFFRR